MRAKRAGLLAVLAAGVVAAAAGAARVKVVQALRANLDTDASPELIQVVDNRVPNPYGGTAPIHVEYARIVDSGQVQQISPKAERMFVRVVRDYVTDARPDVWYEASTGNGGAAPTVFGLVDWTGRSAHVLWRYDSRHSNLGHRYGGASATLFNDPAANAPGREIKLREGVLSPSDAACCPSRMQVSRYKFNRTRYVLYARETLKTR
jgi:hypothetical protein